MHCLFDTKDYYVYLVGLSDTKIVLLLSRLLIINNRSLVFIVDIGTLNIPRTFNCVPRANATV